MSTPPRDSEGLRDRITSQGQDALGRLAQDLLENPLVHGAIARAFEAREKAVQAQEATMAALNLPSAADLERPTRRVRSLSQRLEGIEDGVDRLDERLAALNSGGGGQRLAGIESALAKLGKHVHGGRKAAEGERGGRKEAPRGAAPRRQDVLGRPGRGARRPAGCGRRAPRPL